MHPLSLTCRISQVDWLAGKAATHGGLRLDEMDILKAVMSRFVKDEELQWNEETGSEGKISSLCGWKQCTHRQCIKVNSVHASYIDYWNGQRS